MKCSYINLIIEHLFNIIRLKVNKVLNVTYELWQTKPKLKHPNTS